MSRATHALLSTSNLLHNIAHIRRQAPGCSLIAMVKANAYGHGLRSTALRIAPYVDSLGVASIDEALALRTVGIDTPIVLMEGVFEPSELLQAAHNGFQVVIHHPSQIVWLQGQQLPEPIHVWLKIDTGMGRLGFNLEDADKVYDVLSQQSDVVQPIGIMSHFACADDINHVLNRLQAERFRNFVQDRSGLKSLCNSAALFNFPECHYDVIRPGISLYGVSPFAHISSHALGLRPVMSLHTQLIATRYARKGSTLGYGARYYCPEDMPIGVVAFGYGDGLLRTANDGMPILVNGRPCVLAGRVSMDMLTVDLRACPDARVGDPVTIWGDGLAVDTVARYTSHTAYDILTGVQPRVRFQWID